MKKALVLILALLVLASKSYAVGREDQNRNENETAFSQVSITGSSNTGNPGYIKLMAPNTGGVNQTYYIWVNGVGKLCLASQPTISAYSSFPTGNWNDQTNGMGCTVVGGQS